jgi:tetratricopeptide (TPR) repeat protein
MEFTLKTGEKSTGPTLCLNMIVKNESKIITRMFDTVISIIDSYCICDTGSTDNTVELIQDYFAKKNIPGKVVVEPFKNFCHNRNFALTSCVGLSEFVLLMDADMMLDVRKFNKSMLNGYDSFHILQGNNDFYYHNCRIVRNNGQYSYSGVTHEYINTPSGNRSYNLEKDVIFINDWGDGGCKANKFERDIKLLLDGIKDEPNNARYHFYLANTYGDTNHLEKGIEYYKKRIAFGGWDQEVWYSYYKMGLCYKKMDKMPEAISCWLDGYNLLPQRVENLYEIVNHYRHISKHKLAMTFYEIADKMIKENHNRDGYLFLHNDVYTYKLAVEYTIVAAYVGVKNIDKYVMQILNNSKDGATNRNLLNNMKFYKHILKPIHLIILDASKVFDINSEQTKMTSSSSCLISNETNDGYIMNQRFVNYTITDKGNYLGCDKHIITYNKYIEFDKKFQITKSQFFDEPFVNRRYIGTEDIKIFRDDENKIKFIGTGFHKDYRIGISAGDYDLTNMKIIPNETKCSFNNSDCEKNWVYTNYKGKTHIIYQWHPLQICNLNKEKGVIELVEERKMPLVFANCRGSSCGYTYKNEIWFVVHLVSYEVPRHYYHIIAVFDESLNLLRYSAPFKFHGDSIEYCLSIVVEDDRVIMSYSMWDRTSRIGVYDKKYIDSTLSTF